MTVNQIQFISTVSMTGYEQFTAQCLKFSASQQLQPAHSCVVV